MGVPGGMDCSKDMDESGTLGCQICGVLGRVGGGGLENPPGPGNEGKSFTGENFKDWKDLD